MGLFQSARRVFLGFSLAAGTLHLQAQPSIAPKSNQPQFSKAISLYVTVVDSQRHVVSGLKASDFAVYEDGQPQKIISLSQADVPASIGLLVDNSGSMREKRASITAALLNFVKGGNPQNEFFVVNFNDDVFLDQDFTGDLALIHTALDRLDSRGGTALYDAVIASADHLSKEAHHSKRVLVVVTDGQDNQSAKSLKQALRAVEDEDGPDVYTIGILGHEAKVSKAKRALESLSLETGALAFFPKHLDEVDWIAQAIARDLKSQYTLTYVSGTPLTPGHSKQVKVFTPHHDFETRTRTYYFPEQQNPPSKSGN